ncbi:MAG: hypothetical protein Q8O25_03705 [Sulfurisoma sp.]|nr:hypothetical protein [Sulfurisoma sp.]
MLVYLGICAVLAFLSAGAAALRGVPPAPTFHIAFAVGAMPLVFGAIIHFVPVLTRSAGAGNAVRNLPLVAQSAGIVAVLGLAGSLPGWSLHVAATVTAAAALALAAWVVGRLRATLGQPHPGARWYVAALVALLVAVSLVPLWLARPELRGALRLVHLHLNTLGFIGLAALGTLPVLLPTALARPDSAAGMRLARDLPLAVAGAALTAFGAATEWALAAAGAVLLAAVALRHLVAWQGVHGSGAIVRDGAAAPLAVATLGFVLLLAHGVAHGAGVTAARPAIAAFTAGFLLPLVTGALTQLLPVWHHPGADSPPRREMRRRLASGGALRALLFLTAGVALAFDRNVGYALVAVALGAFAGALLHAGQSRRPQA